MRSTHPPGSGVTLRVDEAPDWGEAVAGPGLVLEVPRVGGWNRRPALAFLAAFRYRLRLSSGSGALLWIHIDGWWDRCGFLRAPAGLEWKLPFLTAPEIRAVTHPPASPAWWSAWTRWFADALVHATHPLLHAGAWCLRPVRAILAANAVRYPVSTLEWQFGQPPAPPQGFEAITRFESFWVEDWIATGLPDDPATRLGAVLPLRAPSSTEDGRVKTWRKRARDGTLPPALLLYVDLLGKWLVIDGHDRLHAALLEGVTPPLLGLWPVHEAKAERAEQARQGALIAAEHQLRRYAPPQTVDRVNRMLELNFGEGIRGTATRAWPLLGGSDAWREEVLAQGRAAGVTPGEDWAWFVG